MKKLLLVGFIFIFLVNYASAYTNINIYIDEAGSALFLGETNEKIDLPLGVEIKNEEIIGKTHKLTTKQGEIWSFFYSLENAELNIILPKSTIIKSVQMGKFILGVKESLFILKIVLILHMFLEKSHQIDYCGFL